MRRFASLAPLVLLLAAAGVLYATGITAQISLENLEAQQAWLRDAAQSRRWATAASFVGLIAVVTAAGIPAGLILALASGFIFGPALGAVVTVLGASFGAVSTYFAARSALGGVLRRWADRRQGALKRIMDGFGRDAFSYVLSMRLIPLAPFLAVNVAAGLARAPVRPYLAATAIGVAPTSLVYATLGSGLGKVFASRAEPDLGIILEPQVFWPLMALAALALVPTLLRRARRKRDGADTESSPGR